MHLYSRCGARTGHFRSGHWPECPLAWWSDRKLQPPIPAGTKIKVVGRSDSNAAAYAFSQWLAQAGNGTWALGVNKTLPTGPGVKVVIGGGNVTNYLLSTPFSIGYAQSAHLLRQPLTPSMPISTAAPKYTHAVIHVWSLACTQAPLTKGIN